MAVDLSRVKDREKLASRGSVPYWQRLRPGCFVGFRPSAKGGAGTWVARANDEEQGGYRFKALGSFAEKPSSERFAAAKQEAEAFAVEVERGGIADDGDKIETVADACRQFAKPSRRRRRPAFAVSSTPTPSRR